MANYKQKLGQFGEKIAKKYLVKKGYAILAEHFLIKGGEIDIIAKKSEKIVFVEVKTRTSLIFGNPEDAVGLHKIDALKRAAESYLRQKNMLDEVEIAFDVIAILVNRDMQKVTLKHFQDIDAGLDVY